MPYSAQRSLVKPLEPSSCAGGLRRAEHFDARRFEIVGEPGDQRRLGPDHHEADVVLLAEADHRRMIRQRRAPRSSATLAIPALPGAQ